MTNTFLAWGDLPSPALGEWNANNPDAPNTTPPSATTPHYSPATEQYRAQAEQDLGNPAEVDAYLRSLEGGNEPAPNERERQRRLRIQSQQAADTQAVLATQTAPLSLSEKLSRTTSPLAAYGTVADALTPAPVGSALQSAKDAVTSGVSQIDPFNLALPTGSGGYTPPRAKASLLGQAVGSLVPTTLPDAALMVLPFAGKIGEAATGARTALESRALEDAGAETLARAPTSTTAEVAREVTPTEAIVARAGESPTEAIGGTKTISASPEGTAPTPTTTTGPTPITTTSELPPEEVNANKPLPGQPPLAPIETTPGLTPEDIQANLAKPKEGFPTSGEAPPVPELASARSPFEKLTDAVTSVDQAPEANAASFSQQRAQRSAIWYSERQKALDAGDTMAEATAKAEPYLRQSGELTRPDFGSLQQHFTPEDLNTLRSEPGYALDDGRLSGPYDVHNTQDALEKVLSGDFGHLAEHELGLLRTVYGPQLADSIAARTAQLGGPQGLASSLHYYAGRGLANLLSGIDSFTTTATFGHLTPLRFGLGQLFSPNSAERAAAREGWLNMYKTIFNPKNAEVINEGLRADPLIAGEGALSATDVKLADEAERRGIQFQNFRPSGKVDDTMVNTILKKLGLSGNRFSQATRAYLDTIQMRSYADGAKALMMGEDATGQTLNPREFRGLYDSYAHIVGKAGSEGELGTKLPTAGNPAFSLQSLVARYKRIFDPLVQPGSINPLAPGARAAAIRGWIGTALTGSSVAGLAQATGLGQVDTDGRIHFAGHTLDPFSGSSSAIRSIYNLESAVQGAKDIPDAATRILNSVQQTARGQVSPGYGFLISLLNKEDWSGRPIDLQQAVENLLSDSTPLGPHSIYDMLQKGDLHGIPGLIQGAVAGGSALLGSSVETPDTLTSLRDQAAQKMNAADYASAGPAKQQLIDNSPEITQYKQDHPTNYDITKTTDEANSKPIQESKRAEASFASNKPLDKALPDYWNDETKARQQMSVDLSTQFAKTFANFDTNKYQDAVGNYYKLDVRDASGNPDTDATNAARLKYVESLPVDQQKWLNESVNATLANKSPLHQQYLNYLKQKDAKGYFAPDITPAEKTALDRANPNLDVQQWYWRGNVQTGPGAEAKSGPALNSIDGVKQALALAPDRPVTYQGIPRAVNKNPQTLDYWNKTAARLDYYEQGGDPATQKAAMEHLATTEKDWATLTPDQQLTRAKDLVRNSVIKDPSYEATLLWWGARDKIPSQEVYDALMGIINKYGPMYKKAK